MKGILAEIIPYAKDTYLCIWVFLVYSAIHNLCQGNENLIDIVRYLQDNTTQHNTQDILKNKICYYYSKECRLKMHKAEL